MPPPDSQVPHFLAQNVNFFRVPVAWEYLQPEMNGKLNEVNLKTYRTFIEKVTTGGAYAAIDLHSASFPSSWWQIVGESSFTPASALVSLWSQLGGVFKDNPLVMFGLSKEPHDLDITKWAITVQAVVTKLRTDKIENILLIPGADYTPIKTFPEWYNAMKVVKNPDGSFEKLIFEAHRYLDSDNSGKSPECSGADEVSKAVEPLKPGGRQIPLAETGGGNTASCMKLLPELAQAVTEAYPVFGGFALWAVGSLDEKSELVTTVRAASSPTGWKDLGNWISIAQFTPPKGSEKAGKSTKSTHQWEAKNQEKIPSSNVSFSKVPQYITQRVANTSWSVAFSFINVEGYHLSLFF
ncbi:hypothetical protein Pst134EA_026975 [Puccinia striiformis f. sp. tritici]|uniref:hypothetical protein n=1 Tax=Puccinia striiformis f. sp. tritici TaxID=168172 RepID=UPI0020088C3F|nr:hypothetical protein Pst134EA_026975 [Puccinia striiformis f. sp. tritici]KAH9450269.1 hypothetical protein Pst134EA_026975 [Puccinia striiformis f. sp. tritici]